MNRCSVLEDRGYKILGKINQSRNAQVFKAVHLKTQKLCCLKLVENAQTINTPNSCAAHELSIMKNIDHPLVIQFYDSFKIPRNQDEYQFICMEYLERGNLRDFVNTNGPLPEDCARSIFTQIITALDYLHNEKQLMHRDIKAENIMLDQNFNIRLIDFGLSTKIEKNSNNSTDICGSLGYMAPELLLRQNYDQSIDIWSTGVLLYGMLTSFLPFEEDEQQTGNQMISETDRNTAHKQRIIHTEPNYPSTLSADVVHLLKRMLQKDPKQRITLNEILQHPWFDHQQYIAIKQYAETIGSIGSIGFHIDEEIKEDIEKMDISTEHLRMSLFMKDEDEASTIFRILRRNKTDTDMIECCSSASSSATCSASSSCSCLSAISECNSPQNNK